jgi:glycosyltransferase involved in cell wall biosynthesis
LWTAWLPLVGLLQRERPDILFSTSGGTKVVVVIAHFLAGSRSRLVLSERNVLMHGKATFKRRLLTRVKGMLYGRADQVTAVSQGVKDDLVEQLGLPDEKVTVVYNPVVSDKILALAKESLDHPWFGDEAPVVLGVGRLVYEKGVDVLIEAVARVMEKRPLRLVILGHGELKAALQARIDDLGLTDIVSLAGFDKNPFRYMSRCDLFVLSSRHEGLPGVLIQAMACGAAVVSTDCPSGPSEIITPEVDGVLVPVEDVEAIAGQIERLLGNGELRQRFGEKGRESAKRFGVEVVIERYEEALDNC